VVRVRELAEGDESFLGEMLYAALFWRPGGERPPIDAVLAHPQGAMYHVGWGRPGDAGVVAEEDGRLLGAAWYRLFTEEEHGHGFVDEQTPELALAVVEGARGRGVGRRLMEAIHELARRDGIARMALSVEPDNFAKRLYESLGYFDYEPGDGHGRMTCDL
jgi:GNAT superfamily N-acetyltransferase